MILRRTAPGAEVVVVGHPLRGLLDAEGVPYETAPSDDALRAERVAADARLFTVPVECRR